MTMRAAAVCMAAMMAASPAFGQTATTFNLACTPVSNTFTGNNSDGDPLTLEDYQGVAEEVLEFAIDLSAGTSCNPHYCSPESFGKPEPLKAVSADTLLFDDIAPREVESNDFHIMGYRLELDRKTNRSITTYTFLDKPDGKESGRFVLVKSCKAAPYQLFKE